MLRTNLLCVLALCAPFVAHGGALSADQPLSAWHAASAADQQQLVAATVEELRDRAGIGIGIALPMSAIVQCVTRNQVPDHITIRGHDVAVTAGLAVVLCVKINIPELRRTRYERQAH